MSEFEILYLPIGVPTFHLESAQVQFEKSVKLLKSISPDVCAPDEMLLSIDKCMDFVHAHDPKMVIIQNITFANAAYATEIVSGTDCPILLWTLREPVIDGGRLRLNSLTGAYSAAGAIHAFRGDRFVYCLGSPDEDETKECISAAVSAARVIYDLKHLKMAQVGHTPQGFGFGRALDLEMREVFGVTLESIESRELIDIAKTYTESDVSDYLEDAKKRINSLENIEMTNVVDFAKLYRAYKEYADKNGIGALSSRCWPDFFTAFGTPVCSVLGILNDLGIAAACEADTYGALSMYVGMRLSGSAVFFGDPVSLDEEENTITYWHCGMAACSLAREDTGACAGLHCNRKIGPTLDFGCRPQKAVTVFRIGRKPDGSFRMFVMSGEALDKPKQFTGTSVVVKMNKPVSEIVHRSVKAGWEPHFAVIYADAAPAIRALGEFMGIEVYDGSDIADIGG